MKYLSIAFFLFFLPISEVFSQDNSDNLIIKLNTQPNYTALSCDYSQVLNPQLTYGSVSDIDGNIYPTIRINNHEWMAANLRTTRFNNGDPIPEIVEDIEWIAITGPGWSYPLKDASLDCPYGKLYNWYVYNDARNICPDGWHIPSRSEFEYLYHNYGGSTHGGQSLKTLNSQYWNGINIGTTNSTGFSGVGAGFRANIGIGGNFKDFGKAGWFSIVSESPNIPDVLVPDYVGLLYQSPGVHAPAICCPDLFSKNTGVSVRCILDTVCDLGAKIIPPVKVAQAGSDSQFKVSGNLPPTAVQWQTNALNTGWINLTENQNYSGTQSLTLTLNDLEVSNHNQRFRAIVKAGYCTDTTETALLLIADTCVVTVMDTLRVYDTLFTNIQIYDTITQHIAVTDTLLISIPISGSSQPGILATVKVFPNPTSDYVVFDFGNYALLSDYSFRISSASGVLLVDSMITQQFTSYDLTTWGGPGTYFLSISDSGGVLVETRKIILQ